MGARTSLPFQQSPPVLRVSAAVSPSEQHTLLFTTPFRIGRADDCEFRVNDDYVSRYQAEAVFENGQWVVRDLGSTNGIFVGEYRVPQAPIHDTLVIRLGAGGPFVSVAVEDPVAAPPALAPRLGATAIYPPHYFKDPASGQPVG